jgi:hypothetical protein
MAAPQLSDRLVWHDADGKTYSALVQDMHEDSCDLVTFRPGGLLMVRGAKLTPRGPDDVEGWAFAGADGRIDDLAAEVHACTAEIASLQADGLAADKLLVERVQALEAKVAALTPAPAAEGGA